MFSIFVNQSLFLIFFLLCSYILGKSILKNFCFFSKVEDFAFAIVTGWAILALLMMLLGFWGLFRPVILFTTFAVIFIASLLSIVLDKGVEFCRPALLLRNPIDNGLTLSVFVFIILYFILLFYISLYPITEWDAIMYHLPVAKEFVFQGRIVPMPFIRFPVGPQLTELFFSLALFFNNPLLADAIQFAITILLVLLIYSFSQRYFNKTIGLFSISIFLSSPIVLRFAVIPYAEINSALFCFLAFYSMFIWITEKQLNYGLLSAIFWGVALASKYYSIPFFFISFFSTAIIFKNRLKFSHTFIFFSLLLLIAFPWYFRNKIYSGDWFFPLRPITGMWYSQDVISHLKYMRSFGMGRDIASFFMLPINLLFHSDKFQDKIGSFLIIGMGSLFFIKRWSRLIRLCVIIVISYSVIWFFSSQILRYMFPIFPILSLVGGWTLQEVCHSSNLKGQWFKKLLIIGLLMLGCFNCIGVIRNNGPMPVTSAQKLEYISKRIPTFRAINFLNNIVQKDEIVYALCDEGSVFYYKNKVIGDWYGFAAYKKVMPYLDKPDILHKVLADYGARYFLIHRNKGMEISRTLFESNLFALLYSDQEAYVFEIL